MDKKYTYHVISEGAKQRIIDFGSTAFPILGSKSATKKAIAAERILINGKVERFSYVLRKGDVIELHGSGVHKVKKYDMELETVFEDPFLLIVNKPGGIAVNGNRFKTIENAVADRNFNNKQPDKLPRPVAVHRIDVPTCGLVMLAKTKSALIRLSRGFQKNKVKKEYLAVVHGQPPTKGRIFKPVDGKDAATKYECLRTVPSRNYKFLSLVRLMPVTGRTHQLRIHMTGAGHLIVGDKLYSEAQKTILGKGMLLCACRLEFAHPWTGKPVVAEISPPLKFSKVMAREEQRYSRSS